MRFESLAASSKRQATVWEDLRPHIGASMNVLPSVELLVAAARRLISGQPKEDIAADFHSTFCHALATLVRRNTRSDIGTISLGGGCLVNRLLRSGLRKQLELLGFDCLFATDMPPGDGGLSFGQAVVGAVALSRNTKPNQVGIESCV